jgi:hypothetical protein
MSEDQGDNALQAEVIPPKRKIGRQWAKGVSGNPKGRPKVPTEIKVRLSQLGQRLSRSLRT